MKFSLRRKILSFSYNFSTIISIILYPALLPTWVFAVLFFWFLDLYDIEIESKLRLTSLVFLTTFAIPVLLIKLLELLNILDDFRMPTRQSRKIPLSILSIYYLLIVVFFVYKINVGLTINLIISAFGLIILWGTLLTFFYKVSLHALGIGGMLGIFFGLHFRTIADFFEIILITTILSGILMSARLRLKAHNSWQIWSGFLIGLTSSFILFYIFTI